MVNFYHQCTEQVTEDQWKRRTSHVTVNCPEIEVLLSKGHMVIDAVVASSPQTSEQGESPATTGNKQIMPCECVHGESLEGLCNACSDTHGREFRLIRTA